MGSVLDNVTFADVTAQMGEIFGSLLLVGIIVALSAIGLVFRLAGNIRRLASDDWADYVAENRYWEDEEWSLRHNR